ncbi:MAG: hypothetical protein IPP14_10260 [Planctomycetes bacterium]|nr:hypothetical protein [Planctomycetota bacterium]
MKPVFRVTAAALTALILMASTINSQEAPDRQDPPLVTQTYDLHGLTREEFARARVPGAISDFLAPDRLFRNATVREADQWSLRESGREACCWQTPHDALSEIAAFCGSDDTWEVTSRSGSSLQATLTAPAAMHQRVQWALQQIKNVAQIRVNVRVHRLGEGTRVDRAAFTKPQAAGLIADARLVGAVTTGLGDPVVLQQTDTTIYVADYDSASATEASAHVPVTGTLVTGQELVAGAIVLSDGRIWVQAWHAERKLEEMRKLATCAGDVELPRVSYRYTPISTVMENGGAAMLDAGPAGRFMVSVTASGNVPDTRLDIGQGRELRLLNAAGALRGSDMGSRWLLTANSIMAMDDAELQQIMMEEVIDGPYNDAVRCVVDQAWACDGVTLTVLGPLLGVMVESAADVEADVLAQRKALLAELSETTTSGQNLSLRLQVVRVPATSAMPSGLLEGRPSALDLAELDSIKGRKVVADRMTSFGLEQNMDLLDARICNHVQGYGINTATGTVIHDPRIAALLLGTQLRWVARDAGEGAVNLEMRAGLTVGSELFEPVEVKLNNVPYAIERSRSNLVQARFAGTLKASDNMSYIVPANAKEDELVVIVVTRIQ